MDATVSSQNLSVKNKRLLNKRLYTVVICKTIL